jgi:hypothetical protein
MSDSENKSTRERSPTYPFISLRKAEERAKQFWEKHRKDGARLSTVADTWEYGVKSSGLQQTVGALKQYGLLEDTGSGEDRKVLLTDLGRRLVADQRDGAREAALKEAAMRPRLFQEYRRWISEMPSESHCLSELELDRGFNPLAAKMFLKAFRETVSFAGLRNDDNLSSNPSDEEGEVMGEAQSEERSARRELHESIAHALAGKSDTDNLPTNTPKPLAQRLSLNVTVGAISVNATLLTTDEVDTVIKFLEANKVLLALGSTH